jgi:predicted GNAT superfamily acetyltransferase
MDVIFSIPVDIEQFQMIEWLQTEIWGSANDSVPAHLLLTIAKEGGVVILATYGDQPVGFAYGFPALTRHGRLKLASHQAGIVAAYQNRGWGSRLKLAQRDFAVERGFDLMTWTYDPLQGRNACLNLHKLGAVCNSYIINLYGEMSDHLNAGVPTDRFRVDWWLKSEHVNGRLQPTGDKPVPDYHMQDCLLFDATCFGKGQVKFRLADVSKVDCCMVEIPDDLLTLKQDNPEHALEWRFNTRAVFMHLFENDFVAVDLIRREHRNFYVLVRGWEPG